MKPDDLQKTVEQKAKTLEEWSEELRKLIPKNPLKVAFDSSKWKRYEKVQQKPLVALEDVKTELASFRVEYDKQVHPSRKQLLTIRNEVHVGLCANAEAKLNKLLSGSEETK